ncbi:Dihydrofolate reductase [Schistosoma japonicum]|nr:Dihydrofolate reductase [Schistosoma japonicum]
MRLNVIVAVSENWGIGKCGGLPWKLRKDMAFFKTVTTKAKSVLLRTPSGVQVVPNLNAAINLLHNDEFSSIVDEIFVIGGYSLYKEVLKQTIYPVRIYCTHILNEVDCDIYFPKVNWGKLKKIDLPDIPVDTFMENGLTYKFCVYDVPSEYLFDL